jgi:hypothetical protein
VKDINNRINFCRRRLHELQDFLHEKRRTRCLLARLSSLIDESHSEVK